MAGSVSSRFAPRPSPSQTVCFRASAELLDRLAQVGTQESLAMSDTIRLVLERGLVAKERKPSK